MNASKCLGIASLFRPSLMLATLIFMCTGLPYLAHAKGKTSSSPKAWVDVRIEPGRASEDTTLAILFERNDSDSSQFVVTSLNLTGQFLQPIVESPDIGRQLAHLTGWYVMHQKGKELWAGVQLEKGVLTGELKVKVPQLLNELPGTPRKYELEYAIGEANLKRIAGNSDLMLFAQIRSVEIYIPNWALVDKDSISGFEPLPADERGRKKYGFKEDTRPEKLMSYRLVLIEQPNTLFRFLNDVLPTAGLVFLTAFFVAGAIIRITRKTLLVRSVVVCAGGICLAVLYWGISQSGGGPIIEKAFFEGAPLLAAGIGLLLVGLSYNFLYPYFVMIYKELKESRPEN